VASLLLCHTEDCVVASRSSTISGGATILTTTLPNTPPHTGQITLNAALFCRGHEPIVAGMISFLRCGGEVVWSLAERGAPLYQGRPSQSGKAI
jgi:hypothetical protein